MAMRRRPDITELGFDQQVEELSKWASDAVSPFQDRNKEEQRLRIEMAKIDYFYFAQTYLPHYFISEPPDFHAELIEMVDARPQPGKPFIMGAVAAPRGFCQKHGGQLRLCALVSGIQKTPLHYHRV